MGAGRATHALALFAIVAAGCVSSSKGAASPGQGGVPSWLPPYSTEQLALLRPGKEPVQVKAQPTYPDPAIFRYAADRRLEDPRDAMKTTKIVADIVSESPRQYTVALAPPSLANDIAQYGPPAAKAPDPFVVARRDDAGRLHLMAEPLTGDAKDAFEDAMDARKDGKRDEVVARLRKAAKLAPDSLAVHYELASALAGRGQLEEAETEFREAIRIDPTFSLGHEGLGRVLLRRGDRYGARVSVAQALAYHPFELHALALATELAPEAPPRPEPFAIFLEVDANGVVRVASGPTVGARMYGGCRAIMRYEPELRSALFDAGPRDPYFLSVAEEMFCIESGIGAYIAERAVAKDEGHAAPEDEQTGALLGLSHTEGLLGFVMYEILGRHRPEHARTAPSTVHRAMVEYVQRHVLAYDPGPDMQNYVAIAAP